MQFQWGRDNFHFTNSKGPFPGYRTDKYYVSDSDWDALTANLEDHEILRLKTQRNEKWGGSCYGMACLSILSAHDIFSPYNYQENSRTPYDIWLPNDNMLSLINSYYLNQYTDNVRWETWKALATPESYKINQLIKNVENGPTIVTFFWTDDEGDDCGHAVVGYEVQRALFMLGQNGKTYDARILLYDNVTLEYDDQFCMYLNTADGEWIIPAWDADSGKPERFAQLGLSAVDLDLINYNGLVGETNTSAAALSKKNSLIVNNYKSACSLKKINLNADGTYTICPDDEQNMLHHGLTDAADKTMNKGISYLLDDPDKAYLLTFEELENPSVMLCADNDTIVAKCENANEFIISPSGYLKFSGENVKYQFMTATASEFAPTEWSEVQVSGTADTAALRKTGDGYVLESDQLENVTVTALNGEEISAECVFSTDQDEAFISEISKEKIGVSVDTDDNGSYETELDTKSVSAILTGDVTGDGAVSVDDAQVTLNVYVKIMAGKEHGLSEAQFSACDVNQDGKISVEDAQYILLYYVKNTLSNSPTDWEAIIL